MLVNLKIAVHIINYRVGEGINFTSANEKSVKRVTNQIRKILSVM